MYISVDISGSVDNSLNRYPHGYNEDTNIIFIQRDRDKYNIIRTHPYSRGCQETNVNWSIYLLITYSYNRLTNNA